MTWCRLDDGLWAHPKCDIAGLEAMGLWTVALTWSAKYLTDGHVPRRAALRLAGDMETLDRLAGRLVAAGLWEAHPSGDGWQVHDYLEFNPSREQVQEQRLTLSEKRAEAGRRGAAAKWAGKTHGKSTEATGESWQTDSKPMASDMASCHASSHAACQDRDHGPDPDPDPDPDPGPDPEKRESSLKLAPPAPKPVKGSRARTKTPVPPSDAKPEDVEAWCQQWSIPAPSANDEVAHMLDYHRKEGKPSADWGASWRTWKKKATEFASRNGPQRLVQPAAPPGKSLWKPGREIQHDPPGERAWKVGETPEVAAQATPTPLQPALTLPPSPPPPPPPRLTEVARAPTPEEAQALAIAVRGLQ